MMAITDVLNEKRVFLGRITFEFLAPFVQYFVRAFRAFRAFRG